MWAQVLLMEDSRASLILKDFIVFIIQSYVYPDGSISAGNGHHISKQLLLSLFLLPVSLQCSG